jgi:hypothetical protein
MVRVGRSVALVLVVALLGACGGGGESGGDAGVVDAGARPELDGVEVVPVASAHHVDQPVDYPTRPPAGGDHYPVWQNCGFYTEELTDELAVHSLEHGAVWITYAPDADDATRQAIAALAAANPYVLASPYPANPAPVVLTAWGRQAKVQSADDPLVAQFLATYLQDGPTTPEPGAACSGAVGRPPNQPNTLIS